jgi:hypothetical protein
MAGAESPEDREAALRAWALEWVESMPDWSDAQWERINAGLGYRVTSTKKKGKGKARKASA